MLRVREVERHSKYLGLPTIVGRSKKVTFQCLKERIRKKIQGWKKKLMSRAGKEVLLKAVIQAIPTYMMSIFRIPDGLVEDIHSMMAQFWWGSTRGARKTHWHSWASLCVPKSKGGMGFRDLKCFNLALLAKQMWRLHNEVNPLLCAVLKARFYKHCGPLEANRGFDPSFSWRSIWGAKSLLIDGLCWRVGNGYSIHVQGDRWLMADGDFVSPNLLDDRVNDLLVGDLIDHECRQWKFDTLNTLFDSPTVANILSIPLAPTAATGDTMFWAFSNDGNYSVRTGYWLGMGSFSRSRIEAQQGHDIWKKIWNQDWPPKLKHFIWRACKNSLPVNELRHHRHMTPSPMCTRCNEASESVCHAIMDCRMVRPLWLSNPHANVLNDAPRSAFVDTFKWLLSHASKEELVMIIPSLWACWIARNNAVMGQVSCDVVQLSSSLVKMIREYQQYGEQRRVTHPQRILSLQRWEPPAEGWVKINFDAHVGPNLMRGMGVVFRDSNGTVLLTGTKRMIANWSVQLPEISAAIFALVLARRMGYDTIHLEGDSLNVLSAICKEEGGATYFHVQLEYLFNLISLFTHFTCSFVRRHGNTVAHMVARWDTGDAVEKICMAPFPPSLQTLVDLDLS